MGLGVEITDEVTSNAPKAQGRPSLGFRVERDDDFALKPVCSTAPPDGLAPC
jgi:hypothetical protein